MEFSIVIAVYNGEKTIRNCLESIFDIDYKNYEVILVNDNSSDRTLEIAKEFPCKIMDLDRNYGPCVARNEGVKQANGEIILFIDSDIVVKKNILLSIRKSFDENPDVSCVVGLFSADPPFGGLSTQYKNLFLHYRFLMLSKYISLTITAITAIKKGVFKKINGFDTRIEFAGEDMDLGQRLSDRGYKILLDKDLQVKHLKEYSFKDFLMNDFKRAGNWIHLFLEKKGYKRLKTKKEYGIVSLSMIFSILLSPLLLINFLFVIFYPKIPVIAFFIFLVGGYIALNIKFWNFLRRIRGTIFAFRSTLLTLFDTLAIFSGILSGLMNYRKKGKI